MRIGPLLETNLGTLNAFWRCIRAWRRLAPDEFLLSPWDLGQRLSFVLPGLLHFIDVGLMFLADYGHLNNIFSFFGIFVAGRVGFKSIALGTWRI